ncbi:malate dehydrogenase (quinone) [Mycobacterium sp. NPDC003323]
MDSVDTRPTVDIALIGGGIMSATLGAMLSMLQPDWRIILLERAADVATESSQAWNNAGTGHSGYCELNYMPDPADGTTAAAIAAQFRTSRRWWSHLVETGLLDDGFISAAPHMDVVFGERSIAYLRSRFETLRVMPAFADLHYSEDPVTITGWAPLVMQGRDRSQRIAATWHPAGTDIDFGALTHGLVRIMARSGAAIQTDHEVRTLRRNSDGSWRVAGNRFDLNATRVFVGAGGNALRLLQRAGLPEVRGYGVLPVGAAFLCCSAPEVVARHDAKVYGQAPTGAPPMSVPHLDRRLVDGQAHLMFGPYATFSTKLLKHGSVTDFFATVHRYNVRAVTTAALRNMPLVRYLIGQLLTSRKRKLAHLTRYYPDADGADWELIPAGQRAQLVNPDGVLTSGTELIVSADRTIAGLLGASPGASTAVPIMIELLQRCFPDRWESSWRHRAEFAVLAS